MPSIHHPPKNLLGIGARRGVRHRIRLGHLERAAGHSSSSPCRLGDMQIYTRLDTGTKRAELQRGRLPQPGISASSL